MTTSYESDGLTDTRVSGVGRGSVTFMPTQSVSVDEQLTSMSKTTCSPGMSACGAAGVAVLEISMSTGCRSAAAAERLPVVGTRRAATTAVATAAWPLPHCHHLPRFARAVPLPNMSSPRSDRHRRNRAASSNISEDKSGYTPQNGGCRALGCRRGGGSV